MLVYLLVSGIYQQSIYQHGTYRTQVRSAKAEGKITKIVGWRWASALVTGDDVLRRSAYRYGWPVKVLAIGSSIRPSASARHALPAKTPSVCCRRESTLPAAKQATGNGQLCGEYLQAIGAELVDKKRREGKATNTVGKSEWLLSLQTAAIGARLTSKTGAPDILAVLWKVESRGSRNGEVAPRDNRPAGVSICGRDRPG